MATVAVSRRYLWFVIAASSAGSMIEWYDFYVFGSLAPILADHFFSRQHPVAALLSTIGVFTVGFLFRPLGALLFGWIGDTIGRKRAFLVTLFGMGLATALIGVIPSYGSIGLAAPLIVFLLRVAQGLMVGGEWGGALTYVAEHAPDGRRGFYTACLSPASVLGLLLSFAVVFSTRAFVGGEAFSDWGWRIPFLLSIVLVGISLAIRLRLQETPLFIELKARRGIEANPLRAALAGHNLRRLLIALVVSFGQAVAWYTGIFWVLFFLQTAQGLDLVTTYRILVPGLVASPLLHALAGWLSDLVGRKPVIMAGFAGAVAGYYPLYGLLGNVAAPGEFNYPAAAAIVVAMQLIPALVWGPLPALMAELFPTAVRYSSLGLVQNAANGWAGGLVPLITTAVYEGTGSLAWSLAYPIALPLIALVFGLLFLPETSRSRFWLEVAPTRTGQE